MFHPSSSAPWLIWSARPSAGKVAARGADLSGYLIGVNVLATGGGSLLTSARLSGLDRHATGDHDREGTSPRFRDFKPWQSESAMFTRRARLVWLLLVLSDLVLLALAFEIAYLVRAHVPG